MTKLYVSADIEGVAGIAHWDEILASGGAYATGQRLLTEEVLALCAGATAGGVTDITVNDAHSAMRNIIPDKLPMNVRLISGHFKPWYMMEGLDETFDAAVFLGYHGPAGSASILSHTYSPRVIWEARIDGEVTGETGINALVAHHFGVPVVLITGDQTTNADAQRWIPEARGLTVKRSIGRFSADSMSPEAARLAIFEAIKAALEDPPARVSRPPSKPHSLELTFQSAEMAELASWAGASRAGDRTVRLEAPTGIELYRLFHVVLIVARSVADA